MHNYRLDRYESDSMTNRPIVLLAACMFIVGVARGADDPSMEEILIGVWKVEPRTIKRDNYIRYNEEGTFSITERLPDGRYVVIVRVTNRIIADVPGLINIPGCEDKKECTYDDATEGIGSSFRSAFYVDYFADNWIDDLFTVKGNVMTADDGNGPIKMVKVEHETRQ